ncbi:MAG TPA: branched-chain amino acid ABC transporter permease [Ensifer sp.]|nr:branched-chain amino acid ABC transporter permease [Ensifer sp.]
MWQEYAIILVRGIGLGSVYALIAMSFNIVKVSSGILNFAQGNMLVLGGMIAYAATLYFGPLSPVLWFGMIIISALIIAVIVTIQGYLTLLPLKHSDDQQSWLITTMAVSIIIGAVLLLAQGPNALMVRSIYPNIPLFGMRVPAPFLMAIGLAIFWYVALQLFMSKTLVGLAISALWQDPVAARAAGLKVRRLQLLAFGISGLVVGSTGFVAAPIITLASDSAVAYVLSGFVALVIGGVASNTGALIAGPLVGVVAMLATFKIGGEFQGLFSMLMLVAILLIRPQGIFGDTTARRV